MPEGYDGSACPKCGSRAIIKAVEAGDASDLSLAEEPRPSTTKSGTLIRVSVVLVDVLVLAVGYVLAGVPGLLLGILVALVFSVMILRFASRAGHAHDN